MLNSDTCYFIDFNRFIKFFIIMYYDTWLAIPIGCGLFGLTSATWLPTPLIKVNTEELHKHTYGQLLCLKQ